LTPKIIAETGETEPEIPITDYTSKHYNNNSVTFIYSLSFLDFLIILLRFLKMLEEQFA
jgi:hypothetical protein